MACFAGFVLWNSSSLGDLLQIRKNFQDQHIFDALSGVSPEFIDHHKDFELYRNLRRDGRAVLKSSDLSGSGTEATQRHAKASLLEYLVVLDSSKPHYTGSIMFIGDTVFAHGGSGFMVSQPAMRMVVNQYTAHKAEIEAYTDGHWAGDCVLGKVFTEAGVKFTDAWPIMQ
ncbi:unnamed protein product [Aureobasidium vineae]|uniref:Uncharacterized protein n=1 Tax=Aureobasidium vineae TaxID=2773715 RepID=A0A9N8JAX5_9PEZI|nr:unnamed protein product [Aureobasidium vineae]